MFSSHEPFHQYSEFAVLGLVLDGVRPPRPHHINDTEIEMTDSLWSVLEQCWKESPQERPTAPDLLKLIEAVDWSVIHPDPDLIATMHGWARPMYFKKRKAAKEQAQAEAETGSANAERPKEATEVRHQANDIKEVDVSSEVPKIYTLLIRFRGLFVAILAFIVTCVCRYIVNYAL